LRGRFFSIFERVHDIHVLAPTGWTPRNAVAGHPPLLSRREFLPAAANDGSQAKVAWQVPTIELKI